VNENSNELKSTHL